MFVCIISIPYVYHATADRSLRAMSIVPGLRGRPGASLAMLLLSLPKSGCNIELGGFPRPNLSEMLLGEENTSIIGSVAALFAISDEAPHFRSTVSKNFERQ